MCGARGVCGVRVCVACGWHVAFVWLACGRGGDVGCASCVWRAFELCVSDVGLLCGCALLAVSKADKL